MEPLFRIETERVTLTWRQARPPAPKPLAFGEPLPGHLVLQPRRPGLSFLPGTWRAGVPLEVAQNTSLSIGPWLFEQTDYKVWLQAKDDAAVELRHRDPALCQDLEGSDSKSLRYGILNFGSQAGLSTFSIWVDGTPELDFELEVFPLKLDYASDYEQLLAEVQDMLTGLALEFLRSTFQHGSSARVPQPTDLEWLILLKRIVDDLERGLRQIERHPIRGLTREPESVRTEKLRRVDSSVRAAIRKGAGAGPLTMLPDGLQVRQRLQERRARPTLDTLEHRWLARQLASIRRRLSALRQAEASQKSAHGASATAELRRARIIQEIDALEARITRLARIEPLVEAEGAPPPGFASLQMLGAPGYREAYRACLELSFGLRLTGDAVQLSVKDLSLLYEYWCYLALIRLVREESGQPPSLEGLFTFRAAGLHVNLQRGRESTVAIDAAQGRRVSLRYNPRFQHASMLVAQQPDMVISFEDAGWPVMHYIIDAKYRLDNSDAYTARYGVPGPPEDALNVLHRYRDAILERVKGTSEDTTFKRAVVQAAAAYPYRDPPGREGAFQWSPLWRSLEDIGIGALPMLPGSLEHLRAWLRPALRRGGWWIADQAPRHVVRETAQDWRQAAGEPVLVGVLRGEDPAAHLAWIEAQRCYYLPLRATQSRLFVTRQLALYLPGSVRPRGAVTHHAEVVGIRVAPRREIATPWPSRRPDEELQVVYALGPVSPLKRAIANRNRADRGQPFRQHRWTTRLALERATRLDELLLETEPEWRLYEQLTLNQLELRIEPDPRVPAIDPLEPRGRVWLVLAGGVRVRYTGRAGFLVQSGGLERYFPEATAVAEHVIGPG